MAEQVQVTFRIPVAMHRELQKAAEERDVSQNYLVKRALEEFLPNLIPVDDLAFTYPREEKGDG